VKRLIYILLFSCTVLVHADMKLNRKTGKFYSIPTTPDISQGEYDKLYRKFRQMSAECERLKPPEYTKFIKEWNALKARGARTKEDFDERNRLQEKLMQMTAEGMKAGDPFWVSSVMLTTFLKEVGTPTARRLQEDIDKITYEELAKLDAVSHAFKERKSWWNWLFLPTREDWKTWFFWPTGWRFWLFLPIRAIIWVTILNFLLAFIYIIGKSLWRLIFRRRS